MSNHSAWNRFSVGKGRFMQGQQNIGHLFDLDQDVVSLVGVDMGARWDHLHLHGADRLGRVEIVVDHAESGDGGGAAVGLHQYRQPSFGMRRGMHDPDAVRDLRVIVDDPQLPVGFHILDIIFHVTEIQGMGIMDPFHFPGMHHEFGVGALVIIFAVVVVQVGMDHHVDFFRFQADAIQSLLEGVNPTANGLFAIRRADRIHFSGVHDDGFLPAFQVPAVNRYGKRFAIIVLVGHHAFVENLGTHDDGVDAIVGHRRISFHGAGRVDDRWT
ncbi:hypothetical protein DESC_710032 [Desulfosarcina cetonica]|nr:hypothetical protein DESC_710032 [Desulfosarcina cetonica]